MRNCRTPTLTIKESTLQNKITLRDPCIKHWYIYVYQELPYIFLALLLKNVAFHVIFGNILTLDIFFPMH